MPNTSGPWQAKLGRSMAFDVSIVNDEGFIVARTSESNGPLIAAAPSMLDALQEAESAMLLADWNVPTTSNQRTVKIERQYHALNAVRLAIINAKKEMP